MFDVSTSTGSLHQKSEISILLPVLGTVSSRSAKKTVVRSRPKSCPRHRAYCVVEHAVSSLRGDFTLNSAPWELPRVILDTILYGDCTQKLTGPASLV